MKEVEEEISMAFVKVYEDNESITFCFMVQKTEEGGWELNGVVWAFQEAFDQVLYKRAPKNKIINVMNEHTHCR